MIYKKIMIIIRIVQFLKNEGIPNKNILFHSKISTSTTTKLM